MTPVRWLLIVSGREVGATFAETRGEAEVALGPIPSGAYVVSAASHAVPLPRAVKRVLDVGRTTCERCRVREKADGSRWCLSCKAFKEREARLNETQNARATRLGLRRGRDRSAENAARRARRALTRKAAKVRANLAASGGNG